MRFSSLARQLPAIVKTDPPAGRRFGRRPTAGERPRLRGLISALITGIGRECVPPGRTIKARLDRRLEFDALYLVTAGHGLPLGAVITGANTGDGVHARDVSAARVAHPPPPAARRATAAGFRMDASSRGSVGCHVRSSWAMRSRPSSGGSPAASTSTAGGISGRCNSPPP